MVMDLNREVSNIN